MARRGKESVVATTAVHKEPLSVPDYLRIHYWWAYLHPRAVRLLERQWLASLILWGNYTRLCDAVLQQYGRRLEGRSLQIGCVYGNFTSRLAQCVQQDAVLEVVDVLPGQLRNLARKLPFSARVRLRCMDSTELGFADASFERALIFFLLHEQPPDVRANSLAEALRVVRPGGTLTIVDYARPSRLNPLRYVWQPVLARLKPFASDLWRSDITAAIPPDVQLASVRKQRFFGGLYQMVVLTVGQPPHTNA